MWKTQVTTNDLEINYCQMSPPTFPRQKMQNTPNFQHAKGKKQVFLNHSFNGLNYSCGPVPCLAPLPSRARTLTRSPKTENLQVFWKLLTARSFPVLPPRGTGKPPLLSPPATVLRGEGVPGRPLHPRLFLLPCGSPRGKIKGGVCRLRGCSRWRESA